MVLCHSPFSGFLLYAHYGIPKANAIMYYTSAKCYGILIQRNLVVSTYLLRVLCHTVGCP